MPITGGCRCGNVRYELALETLPLSYACHCLDCQTWSGSAFAIHVMLREDILTLHQDTHHFQLDGAERMPSTHIGCMGCLTRIANRNAAIPGMIILRAGTLDRSHEIIPAVHIWTKRAQAWLNLPPGAPTFSESPSPDEFAAALAG